LNIAVRHGEFAEYLADAEDSGELAMGIKGPRNDTLRSFAVAG
jgi:hypothetical protein